MDVRGLAEAAWSWTLDQVADEDGPWFPETVPGGQGPDRDTFYGGIAGLAAVLAEIALSRPLSDRESSLSEGIVERLGRLEGVDASLYCGLSGSAAALHLLGASPVAALDRIRSLATPSGWATPGEDVIYSDVIGGAAGIVMTALWAGDLPLASLGCDVLLGMSEETPGGLDWRTHPGYVSSSANFSHGTAGVGSALALAAVALDRPELLDAAVRGAAHLVSVAYLDNDGFVVPHTLPFSKREVEPVTYTWCHGPAGTSQFFAALAAAGVNEVGGLSDLRQRCFVSTMASGLPDRLRPGFWDNDGRCCGTAGVADIVLDAAQDLRSDELLAFAVRCGEALVERAVDGRYWQFIEYRIDDPLLPPGTSWMQGSAGIAAFLFRLARVLSEGLDASVVTRPDQYWTVPSHLRHRDD